MGSDKITAEDYFNQAFDFECNGNHEKALHFYNEALRLDSDMKKAYKYRGRLCVIIQDYEKAIGDFEHLLDIGYEEDFLEKRALCYEKLGNYEKSLELYCELLIRDVNMNAFERICAMVKERPELRQSIDVAKINELIEKYIDEDRAKKFHDSAPENNLDYKNYFLDLAISLLPKTSDLGYRYHIDAADSKVFQYRICLDETFREEYKKANCLREEELQEKYLFNKENVTIANLIFAVQTLNEATRFAKNLDEVNLLDVDIKSILDIVNYKMK